jgi:hypothetical protein
MKNLVTILIFIMISCHRQDYQKKFIAEKIQCKISDSLNEGYKIVFKDDIIKCAYNPLVFKSYSDKEKIAMIQELLLFQGDTNRCVLRIAGYNPLKSQIYAGNNRNYTLQMEALFIINQIYFKDPFKYSSYPIIYNKKTKKYLVGNEIEMQNVYKLYLNWFKKIKNIEIDNFQSLTPLDGSEYEWY